MDNVCTNCGEPWDVFETTDNPEEFKTLGAVIESCPCCQGKQQQLSKEEQNRLAIIQELGGMAGDDVDGFVCELEDFGLV